MNRREFLTTSGALAGASAALAQPGSHLTVQVTYIGSGTVDEKRQIFVALWDNPNFMKDASGRRPFTGETVKSKDGSAEFRNVQVNPVYVTLVYDPTGSYDGNSEPPAGCSFSIYGKRGVPDPVQLKVRGDHNRFPQAR